MEKILISKRIFFGAIIGYTLLFFACRSDTKAPLRVLLIAKNIRSDFHQSIINGAQILAKENGIELEVVGPDTETNYKFQQNEIEYALKSKRFGAVILSPNHSTLLLENVHRLNDAGIPFVIVDTPISFQKNTPENYCGFVGTDNVLGGELAARFLGRTLRNGNVLLVRGLIEHRSSSDREFGFRRTLAKFFPKLRIIKTINGKWRGDAAVRAFRQVTLPKMVNIHAIFALNDDMALAIAELYKDKPKRPYIVGFNGSKAAQKAVLEQKMAASIVQMPEEMGSRSMQATIECTNESKEKRQRNLLIPTSIVSAIRSLRTTME